MDNYITELDCLKFNDQEMENFFNKFNSNSLETFDLILYFSGFSGNTQELVTRLKESKNKVYNNKSFDDSEARIEQEIFLLSDKELELLIGLLDEAQFCAQCDGRYPNQAYYLDYLKTKAEMALAESINNKQKVLSI